MKEVGWYSFLFHFKGFVLFVFSFSLDNFLLDAIPLFRLGGVRGVCLHMVSIMYIVILLFNCVKFRGGESVWNM